MEKDKLKNLVETELFEFAQMKALTPREQENLLSWMQRTEHEAKQQHKGRYTKQIAKLQKIVNKNFQDEHRKSVVEERDIYEDGDILGPLVESDVSHETGDEQLDELSAGTLHSYVGTAERSFRANPVKKRAVGIKRAISGLRKPTPPMTESTDEAKKLLDSLKKKHSASKAKSKVNESTLNEVSLHHDILQRIDTYKKMGFRVENEKVESNSGEFTVIDKEGNARRHIFSGTKRKVENLGNMRPSTEEGGEQVKKKRGRPKKDKFA